MKKIETVKLDNGLEVHFLFDKKFTTSSIKMLFKVGWRNDKEENLGLAHLFEHLVGKRTARFKNKSEFAKKLEDTGIYSNAWTSADSTVYLHNQTHENLYKSLELLLEAIYFSTFDPEDLEKEKEVVLTEARRYLDNDSSVLWQNMTQALFPETSMCKFLFGTKETLGKIDVNVFSEYYNRYQNPKNSVLFIGTDSKAKKQKIIKLLNNFFDHNSKKINLTREQFNKITDSKQPVKSFLKVEKKDKSQSEIRVAYRFDKKLSTKERVAFGVMRQILVGGLTGKLMKVLRDDMGLVYGVDIWWDEYLQGLYHVTIETECAKDKRDVVIKEITEFIHSLKDKLSDKDIKNVIPKAIYLTKSPVVSSRDVGELLNSCVYEYEYLSVSKHLQILRSLKAKDIIKLADKIFIKDTKSVIVME